MGDACNAGARWNLIHALGRPQHDADPRQVIRDGCRSGTGGSRRTNAIDQDDRCELQGVRLAEVVMLEKFQMALLAALPFQDLLECVYVPADDLSGVRDSACPRAKAPGVSKATSRCFAHLSAAPRRVKVFDSWCRSVLPWCARMTAVQRGEPSAALRTLVCALCLLSFS